MSTSPHKFLVTVVLLSAGLAAQTLFDFESGGFDGWQPSGAAFQNARVRATDVFTSSRLLNVPLGGGYWQNLPYPIGQHGEHLISTILKPPHSIGTLTSPPIVLNEHHLELSARIGGTKSAETRFELHIADRVVFRETGDNQEGLRVVTFSIPRGFARQTAVLQIVDNNPTGHINVDYVRLTGDKAPVQDAPVWGIGDIHTHLFSNLAFGHARNVDVMWGEPGGAYASYLNPDGSLNAERVGADLRKCTPKHGGGFTTEAFINTVQEQHPDPKKLLIGLLQGKFTRHGRHGAPDYEDFPSFLSSAHQQMHVTQIHRAWEGGLRLLVQLAVNNKAVEYIASKLGSGDYISLTHDSEILKNQLEATRYLAAQNSDWMAIATSPAAARAIIQSGRLAIIQGVEMDQMSEMFPNCDAKCEVDQLWNMGVRHVFPVHAADNRLGGAAVFEDAYNSLTDLLYGDHPETGNPNPAGEHFMNVKDGCPVALDSECAVYHLTTPASRVGIKRLLFWKVPFPLDSRTTYKPFNGHKNKMGLTDDGRTYVTELMNRGMLVDLAHMSDESIDDVYRLMASRLGPGCSGFGWNMQIGQECFDDAYPIVESHVHFRSLAADSYSEKGGPGVVTTSKDFARQEYQLSDRQAEMIRRTSGIAGQFITEYPIKTPTVSGVPFHNDCGLSSKSFGYAWLYAIEKLGFRAGVATDMTFIPMVSPRFGKDACKGYQLAPDPDLEKKTWIGQYDSSAQTREVDYNTIKPYRLGKRLYNFNTDGLAHYGMLPDMLEDLHNLGLSSQAFAAIFNTAEAYIETWEKAERLARLQRQTKPIE